MMAKPATTKDKIKPIRYSICCLTSAVVRDRWRQNFSASLKTPSLLLKPTCWLCVQYRLAPKNLGGAATEQAVGGEQVRRRHHGRNVCSRLCWEQPLAAQKREIFAAR